MADDSVRVEGLTELRQGLRQASKNLPKVLTKAHQKIAKAVAADAKPRSVTRHGNPTPSSSTIRGTGSQTGADVRASGATAMGDEFGGGSRPTTRQFRPWKGSGEGAGYAIWEAVRAQRPQIEDALLDGIVAELEAKAFPD